MLTCANCGAAMDERKCKLICRCGYFLSCSRLLRIDFRPSRPLGQTGPPMTAQPVPIQSRPRPAPDKTGIPKNPGGATSG